MLELFSTSENIFITRAKEKALLNVYLIPMVLTFLTMNILFIVAWWLFIYLIYRFVFTGKKLNKLYFLRYLKYALTGIFLFIVAFAFYLVLGE
ncbi:MAG: hypothetical protein AB7D96_02420 [Arcobacteraceae bacterium]